MNDHCNFSDLPPMLDKSEAERLGQTLLNGTDEEKDEAKCRLIESNIRLVIKMAKDYANLGVDVEDLVNEGNMGLMVAAEKFDPNRGAKFSTYASFWVRQKIMRALNNSSSLIRLPVYLKQRYLNIRKFISRYTAEHDDAPSNELIAKEFGVTVAKVEKLFEITAPIFRLDSSVEGDEGKAGRMLPFIEIVCDAETFSPSLQLERKEQTEFLSNMLSCLPEREEYIIRHRFGLQGLEKETLEKIGNHFGITRERIRQVEDTALRKLQFMYRNRKKG